MNSWPLRAIRCGQTRAKLRLGGFEESISRERKALRTATSILLGSRRQPVRCDGSAGEPLLRGSAVAREGLRPIVLRERERDKTLGDIVRVVLDEGDFSMRRWRAPWAGGAGAAHPRRLPSSSSMSVTEATSSRATNSAVGLVEDVVLLARESQVGDRP